MSPAIAASQRRRVSPAFVARVRLRLEDWVVAVPAAILPAGWSVVGAPRGPGAFSDLAMGPYVAAAVVAPAEARLLCNSHREPDQLDIRIPWRAMPLDPRVLRAVGVEFWADAVEPFALNAWRSSGVPPFPLDRSRLRWMGTADRWAFDETRAELQISGRDFTGLLLDQKLSNAAAAGLNMALDLVTVCQAMVDSSPATRGMRCVWVSDVGATSPRIAIGGAPAPSPKAPPSARKGATRAARRSVDLGIPYLPPPKRDGSDVSIWDAITDVTTQVGCIAWVHLDEVKIAQARTVFLGASARQFVRAQNCTGLRFARDLGRRSVKAVEVRCWDTDGGRRLISRFPTGTPASEEDVIRTVSGISAQDVLDAVAEALYYELRRNQASGSLETASMSEIGTDSGGLLAMRAGDVIDVQPGLAEMERGQDAPLPPGAMRERLVRTGIAPAVADALASAAENRIGTLFWATRADHRFSASSGYRLAVEFSELPTVGAPKAAPLVVQQRVPVL